MIAKNRYVRASKVSFQKASSSLKSHMKYIQYRKRNPLLETKEDRHLFNKDRDHVDRRGAHDEIMGERVGDIYYHRLILSPASNEPVHDWHTWTREVMQDLEDHLGMDLHWYASHHHNTDDPHVHVALQGTGENKETGQAEPVVLTPVDFKVVRESGRAHSGYDHYRLIEETLREMNEREMGIENMPDRQMSEPIPASLEH